MTTQMWKCKRLSVVLMGVGVLAVTCAPALAQTPPSNIGMEVQSSSSGGGFPFSLGAGAWVILRVPDPWIAHAGYLSGTGNAEVFGSMTLLDATSPDWEYVDYGSNTLHELPMGYSYSAGYKYILVKPSGSGANLTTPALASQLEPNPVLTVTIDIKPGSTPNAINLGSNGVVPVAILGSAEFDATEVDPETVTLAGAGVAVRGKGDKLLASEEDVNGDGFVDLSLKVETENLDPGTFQDGFAILTGLTYAGDAIEGSDEITIVPPE